MGKVQKNHPPKKKRKDNRPAEAERTEKPVLNDAKSSQARGSETSNDAPSRANNPITNQDEQQRVTNGSGAGGNGLNEIEREGT